MNPHVVAIDFETTGTDCSVHQIAEVGLIRVTADLQTELCRYSSKVAIEDISKANSVALSVFGYDPQAWAEAPNLYHVMRFFSELCQGAVPLAYNASFDLRFANAAFARFNIPRPWAGEWTIDVMRHGRALKQRGEIARAKLNHVAQYVLGRGQGDSHRALDDVELALDIERSMRYWGQP